MTEQAIDELAKQICDDPSAWFETTFRLAQAYTTEKARADGLTIRLGGETLLVKCERLEKRIAALETKLKDVADIIGDFKSEDAKRIDGLESGIREAVGWLKSSGAERKDVVKLLQVVLGEDEKTDDA